jgi:hypothetical protein
LTALAYHRAAAIISTNADCLTSARKLQPDQSRIVRGLHGFDERQVLNRLDFAKSHHSTRSARFNISSEIALFLHPARQDWGIKGNDLLLEAIVELRKDKNLLKRPFVVVLAEWGNDVQKAKEFIRRNRIDDFIQWTEILSKTRLIHAVAEADAIIDQFKIPCIGAIPAEFLTVSRGPLITNLDDEIMSAFYGETLPILKAATPSEIAMNMRLVINDDEAVNKSVRASKDWVKRNHSHLVVLSKCLDAYDRVLSSNSSDGQK